MFARLQALWEQINTGLWFVPGLMLLGALLLAWLSMAVSLAGFDPDSLWWLSSGDRESVAALLSTLLTSMITLATLAISITMVVLTLAAGQLGPRLIRSFMADKSTQFMLGFFLATIVYLVVVLRGVNADLGREESHHVVATVGAALSLGCVVLLLFFVHHLGRSIVADTVIERVGRQLDATIEEMLPKSENTPSEPASHSSSHDDGAVFSLVRGGYVQAVDHDALVECAKDFQCQVLLDFRPGHFLIPHGAHGRVYPASNCSEKLIQGVRNAIAVGGQRSAAQDLEYAIRQLVEVALRALSPGINDPFTAIVVIDRLGLCLAEIMRRDPPKAIWQDDEGCTRVVGQPITFAGLTDAAFNQIRQSGGRPAILIQMMAILKQLAEQARTEEHRQALDEQVGLVLDAGERCIAAAYDRRPLETRAAEARRHLAAMEHAARS
ncbi:DUF2254 domain-containing protein [Aquibaculum arenosum]|uniref:DUF2254 domain-containing protein n=1 Tax=Aquibaculum arenosum TaxID=3032591 RepID=A0ABT5YMX8_9PROT|nr:DUF2254 domain-containing protein [Fodinicurvata sp. CAU 1616]MDF2096278.1 DUF2254 domain-containing protein [Fodinicurvata sp. CAU 1616]